MKLVIQCEECANTPMLIEFAKTLNFKTLFQQYKIGSCNRDPYTFDLILQLKRVSK